MTDKIHNGWEIIFACAMESSITVHVWSREETAGSIQTGRHPAPERRPHGLSPR
jgi:hypothetical protein